MIGRAYSLLLGVKRDYASSPFRIARIILMAGVAPQEVSPELDDPELEQRIEDAILRTVVEAEAPRPARAAGQGSGNNGG